MFPIGTIGRTNYRPYMTFYLIFVNVLVFLWQIILFSRGEAVLVGFLEEYALAACRVGVEPIHITGRNALFTMFMHGSIPHLIGNMVFLWIFGPKVEAYFGHRRFLAFYLLAGIIASVIHVALSNPICDPNLPNGSGIIIGASGAIAGVMGAFLFLHPGAKVRTALIFMRIPFGIINVSAYLYLIIWLLMDVIGLMVTDSSGGGVAHWAHIGGFLAGLGMVFVATMFKPAPPADPFEYMDE